MGEGVLPVVQIAGVLLVATALASVLSGVLYPSFRRAVAGYAPATRSLATFWFALIAPAVGLFTLLIYLSPAHAQSIVFAHCHGSLCDGHAPMITSNSLGGIGLLAVTAVLASAFAATAGRVLITGRRRLAVLFALSTPRQKHLITESDRLFAWCCGLFRQRIVISSALAERLSASELEVILAHERAHEARFDNLRNLSARWATSLWPAGNAERIRSELAEDAEQACDAVALREYGDPALFSRAVQVVASDPTDIEPGTPVRFGTGAGDVRLQAAVAGRGRYPGPAYLLVAVIWTLQLTVVAAVSHPIVEGLSALSW